MNWFKKIFITISRIIHNEGYKLKSDEIYLHEDLYCQIELLPIENTYDLLKENDKINEFSNEHFDGIGFTEAFERGEQKTRTSERQIQLEELDSFMVLLGFEKMTTVFSGYGNYMEKCINTNAYTIDGATIFCDYQDGLIQNIWLYGFRCQHESNNVDLMTNALYKIGSKWNLTLNDWDLTENINLGNKSKILEYITEK